MATTERYLFDLNGDLTVPGALSVAQVQAINAPMDERIAGEDVTAL